MRFPLKKGAQNISKAIQLQTLRQGCKNSAVPVDFNSSKHATILQSTNTILDKVRRRSKTRESIFATSCREIVKDEKNR